MNKRTRLFVLGNLFLFAVLEGGATVAQSAQSTPHASGAAGTLKVDVSHDRLSVQAVEAPVAQIFEEIGKQAKIRIDSNIGPEEKITIRLDRVPIEDGIRQLANNVSFFYAKNPTDKTRRIERVVVLSTGSGVSRQATASSQPEKRNQPPPQQVELSKPPPQPEPFKFEFDPGKFGEKQKAGKRP